MTPPSREELLAKAMTAIIEANKDFRDGMPQSWDGDPLQDACDAAAKLLAVPDVAQRPLDPCPYLDEGRCELEEGSIGPCLCVNPVAARAPVPDSGAGDWIDQNYQIDRYGVALMMIREGCADPAGFARRVLAEFTEKSK